LATARPLFPAGREWLILPAYTLCFALLHKAAGLWAGTAFFSLCYPAAGLRLAVLWRHGARLAPWLMAAELITDSLTGVFHAHGTDLAWDVTGVLRPGLAYGLTVAVVRRIALRHPRMLAMQPMELGLAAVLAPLANALLLVPMISNGHVPGTMPIHANPIVALTSLVVGDMLGILMLSPPLLWLLGHLWRRPLRLPQRPGLRHYLEGGAMLLAGLCLTLLLWHGGLGVQAAPMLLSGALLGLRHGRLGAWCAILAQAAAFLPVSSLLLHDAERLQLHLGLAMAMLATWLAGSFADAQVEAAARLERNNRLLFQAERLKTLRAMSVAVIHELSQPLSTLAIEANHLHQAAAALPSDWRGDLAQSAQLVDRKARTLADLVRRLRRFGERDVQPPGHVPVAGLIDLARRVVAPEWRTQNIVLHTPLVPPGLAVHGREIELTQALVNLLRNAANATSDGAVHLDITARSEELRITVSNSVVMPADGAHSGGMGVGLIIARSIVEAHGGRLHRQDVPGSVRFAITLAPVMLEQPREAA
jgi:signal transduction histidine kinase